MNKLYSVAFRRLLKNLSTTDINTNNIQSVLDANNIKPTPSYLLYRLPRHQLKTFLKQPCPVQNVQTEANKQIITSSKSLRANYSIIQQKVCEKCPHKNSCQQFAKPGKQSYNAISDLLLYMSAMDERSNVQSNIAFRIWSCGYKLGDNVTAVLQDLKQGGNQTLEFQKIRLSNPIKNQQGEQNQINKEQKIQKKSKKEKKQKRQENQFNDQGNKNELSSKHKFQYDQYQKLKKIEKSKLREQRSQQYRQKSFGKNDYDRRPPKNRSRIQQNDNRPQRSPSQKNYNSQWQQRRPRRNSQERSFNRNYDNDKRYQNRREQPNRRDQPNRRGSYQNNYQNKRYQNEDRQYKVDKYERNENRYNNSEKENRKSRIQNSDPIDNKFEKSGEVYKNSKIYQSWDEFDESSMNKNQSHEGKVEKKDISSNIQKQKGEKTEERRGRKVRK